MHLRRKLDSTGCCDWQRSRRSRTCIIRQVVLLESQQVVHVGKVAYSKMRMRLVYKCVLAFGGCVADLDLDH